MKEKKSLNQNELEKMEIAISNCLRFGVFISAMFIFVGIMMFLITGKSGYSGTYFPKEFYEVLIGTIDLKPYAIILTGLILLIFTPIFRVGVSIFVFLKNKDYTFSKITIFVFLILILSFLLGKIE